MNQDFLEEQVVVIKLYFLTGRYHATPWYHNVNEGVVEWPPSPWRLLRALIATYYRKSDCDIFYFESIIEKLASVLPEIKLPVATVSHTRHYMPQKSKTAKIFDTFVHMAKDDPLCFIWRGVRISDNELKNFKLVAEELTYFGRCESWVRAVAETDVKIRGNCFPSEDFRADIKSGQDLVKVLVPVCSDDYLAWREAEAKKIQARTLAIKWDKEQKKGKDPTKVKLTKKELGKIEDTLPVSLFRALMVDVGELRNSKRSRPPGSRYVSFIKSQKGFSVNYRLSAMNSDLSLPTVARFAVASSVPPRLTQALSVSERIHKALTSRLVAPVFTGCDENKKPLSEGHRHVFIIPEANGRSGAITHVTVCARMGFDESARIALEGVHKVWGYGGKDIQLILLGLGQPEDFSGMNRKAGQCSLLVSSEHWISRTPFVPTRHPKVTRAGVPKCDLKGLQIGSPEHDLRRLIAESGLPEPAEVQPIGFTLLSGKITQWHKFGTRRHSGNGRRSQSHGFGYYLRFPEFVSGPLALGFGAHFGLGVFEPAQNLASDRI